MEERLAQDFLDFIGTLNRHDVEFVLVGGYALGVHGVIRATGDIDFLYRRSTENVARLCRALEEFGAPPIVIDPTSLMHPDMVSMFGNPPVRIDLLSNISGVTYAQVWKGRVTLALNDETLHVIGLTELRASKAASGRAKDKSDLRLLDRANRKR